MTAVRLRLESLDGRELPSVTPVVTPLAAEQLQQAIAGLGQQQAFVAAYGHDAQAGLTSDALLTQFTITATMTVDEASSADLDDLYRREKDLHDLTQSYADTIRSLNEQIANAWREALRHSLAGNDDVAWALKHYAYALQAVRDAMLPLYLEFYRQYDQVLKDIADAGGTPRTPPIRPVDPDAQVNVVGV